MFLTIVFNSKNTYCLTQIHKNDHKIDYNHDTGPKLGNLIVVLNKDLKYVGLLSTRY